METVLTEKHDTIFVVTINLRSDRLSSYEQWGMPLEQALRNETRRGLEVINSGETREGARRFASGHGRHGRTDDV